MAETLLVVDPVTQLELPVPDWATPEDVIARAARERAGELIQLYLFVEWTVTWPVWEVGGDEVDSDSLHLSAELSDALRGWVSFRDHHLEIDSGWSSDEDRDWWRHRAHELEERLERESWKVARLHRRF